MNNDNRAEEVAKLLKFEAAVNLAVREAESAAEHAERMKAALDEMESMADPVVWVEYNDAVADRQAVRAGIEI